MTRGKEWQRASLVRVGERGLRRRNCRENGQTRGAAAMARKLRHR